MGCGDAVAEVTNKAMDGSMNLEQALEERLRIIDCTPADIKRFIKAHPPSSRLVPVSGCAAVVSDAAAVAGARQLQGKELPRLQAEHPSVQLWGVGPPGTHAQLQPKLNPCCRLLLEAGGHVRHLLIPPDPPSMPTCP